MVPLEDDPLLEGSTRTSRDVPADAAAHVHGSVSASALSLPSLDKRDSTATNDSPTKLAQSVTQEVSAVVYGGGGGTGWEGVDGAGLGACVHACLRASACQSATTHATRLLAG